MIVQTERSEKEKRRLRKRLLEVFLAAYKRQIRMGMMM
jgi:hypothetical protein